MTKLTMNQIKQLNTYSIYTEQPEQKLFSLETFLKDPSTALKSVQSVSKCPNTTVTASYFTRRFSMFTAFQFYNLATYDEIWDAAPERLIFGQKEEFGNQAVSLFIHTDDWREVEEQERKHVIKNSLLSEYNKVIKEIRIVTNISSLTLWENLFGFLLWHYYVLLENPGTSAPAIEDFETLLDDTTWDGIAPHSLFSVYMKGNEPSALLNTVVRFSCCLSKDVPGLMQCGFCPLK